MKGENATHCDVAYGEDHTISIAIMITLLDIINYVSFTNYDLKIANQ
jgi:hypothetical protein